MEEAFFVLKHSKGSASNGEQETSRQVQVISNRGKKEKKSILASLSALHIHIIYNEKSPRVKHTKCGGTVLKKTKPKQQISGELQW